LIHFAQSQTPCTTATLDQDATLTETHKRDALYCYKKYKAYQPFNTYWCEQEILLHSEFRDGNVNAGYEQLRLLKGSLKLLPLSMKKVLVRSDSAAFQKGLIEYCGEGENERFKIIEFAICADVTQSFKNAALKVEAGQWKHIYKIEGDKRYETNQEYAEVYYVPNWVGLSKKKPDYQFIAIREPMKETKKSEDELKDLPFQTLDMSEQKYKIFGIVTNRTIDGNELINWHRQRCGYSEKVHSIQKNELARGQLPSGKFGANVAWWQIMILAFNLNILMRNVALPKDLKTEGMKA
jgi:hypothetical protein